MTILILSLVFLAVVLIASFKIVGFGGKLKQARILIGDKTFKVEVADTVAARTNGLSGRSGLGDGEGMYFVFGGSGNYGFWMKDMKFPIDIIWISEGKVVGLTENVAPEPGKPFWGGKIYYPPELVAEVVEMNGGSVEKYQIKIGDSVSFRPGGVE